MTQMLNEAPLPDFDAALLAYVEGCASHAQRQAVEQRMAAQPELHRQVKEMIADRAHLHTLPSVTLPASWQWRQAVVADIQRGSAHARVLARIRYAAVAVAALLLVSAISFRVIWPAVHKAVPPSHLLAARVPKLLNSPPAASLLTSGPTFALRNSTASQDLNRVAAGGENQMRKQLQSQQPHGAALASRWTMAIRLKNAAQGHKLERLLTRFTRQNQPHLAGTPPQEQAKLAVASQHRYASLIQPSKVQPRLQAATKSAVGIWMLALDPAQIHLLRANFAVVQLRAPLLLPARELAIIPAGQAPPEKLPPANKLAAKSPPLASSATADRTVATHQEMATNSAFGSLHAQNARAKHAKSTVALPRHLVEFTIQILPPRQP